jgi:Protein of unknown function (DUF2975)
MRPENEARLARIKKISWILRWICRVFLVLCVLGFLKMARFLAIARCQISGVVHCSYTQSFNGVAYNVSDLTDRDRVVVGVILALSWGVIFNCGYQLHRLLDNYSRGEVFTTESAGQIRKWGIACVLWGVLDLGWMLVPHMIVNARNEQQGGWLSLVGNGLVIVAISWFMEMAAEMREEQDLII